MKRVILFILTIIIGSYTLFSQIAQWPHTEDNADIIGSFDGTAAAGVSFADYGVCSP